MGSLPHGALPLSRRPGSTPAPPPASRAAAVRLFPLPTRPTLATAGRASLGASSEGVHGETLQTPTLFPMPWGHLDTLRPPPEKALPEPVDLDTFARPDWL